MSESSLPARNPSGGASGFDFSSRKYQLSEHFARLCLPQKRRDSCRALAWANSVCALFLCAGLIGLKPPAVVIKPFTEIQQPVPVVFIPAEEQPKVEPEVKPYKPEQAQDTPEETPQVAAVVAAADPAAVAFAVPVQGAVAVAPAAHLATPPPPVTQAPPRTTQFNPQVSDGGTYPPPAYPATARRNGNQGTVVIEILVNVSGDITSTKVHQSSGFTALDEAALKVVRNRWRFPPGRPRHLHWPCVFRLN